MESLVLGDDDVEAELFGGHDAEVGQGWLELLHQVVVDVLAVAALVLQHFQEADGGWEVVNTAAAVQD